MKQHAKHEATKVIFSKKLKANPLNGMQRDVFLLRSGSSAAVHKVGKTVHKTRVSTSVHLGFNYWLYYSNAPTCFSSFFW